MDAKNTMKRLKIQFLEVDMSKTGHKSCSECSASEEALLGAINSLKEIFGELNCVLDFTKTVIRSKDEALKLNFGHSPTIRIGSENIYPFHVSEKEGERSWVWRGQLHKVPTKQLLVEFIMHSYLKENSNVVEITQYVLQFLEGREKAIETRCGCS